MLLQTDSEDVRIHVSERSDWTSIHLAVGCFGTVGSTIVRVTIFFNMVFCKGAMVFFCGISTGRGLNVCPCD